MLAQAWSSSKAQPRKIDVNANRVGLKIMLFLAPGCVQAVHLNDTQEFYTLNLVTSAGLFIA
jgi:hypothetical protein